MNKHFKRASALALAGAFWFGGSAQADVIFGDGGVALQGVLDGITTAPTPGVSSVDVVNDQVQNDELWAIGGSGGSVATVIIELAGYAGTNTFGIYDAANSASQVQVFAGAATTGTQSLVSILADGSVILNFVDTGIDFAGNAFGFYLDSTAAGPNSGVWYSETSLNVDGTDHMAAYEGQGDTIQILPFAPGPWTANEYALAFEDLNCNISCDRDYTDFVVLVESINPIPAPAPLALIGLGLVGFGLARRLRKS